MASKSNSQKNWFLPRNKLEELLDGIGVQIVSDTSTDLIGYCPFHNNRDSPAFNISLTGPHLWKCHNGRCAKQGNIVTLLLLKGYERADAHKMLLHGLTDISDIEKRIAKLLADAEDVVNPWEQYNPKVFQDDDENSGFIAKTYFRGRGITEASYEYFGLGFSSAKDMVIIPIYNETGVFSGVIGREWRTKRYEYSEGLARRDIIYNLHNARWQDHIVLTEGALDAIYIWQSGEPSVGSILGSAISTQQFKLLRKYFSEVICFFDNDEAGKAATEHVINELRDVVVSYVEYPREVKDPGDLTAEEIKTMLHERKNRVQWLLNN